MLWSSISKRIVHKKINELIKKVFYDWILRHTQVLQSTIANVCLKACIDGHYELQVVTTLLLQVPVWKIHNVMASSP